MSSKPTASHVFTVTNYAALDRIKATFKKRPCEGKGHRFYIRGGFKKFEEKCCQIVSFHGKFTISMHVVHKHIVNICTKF